MSNDSTTCRRRRFLRTLTTISVLGGLSSSSGALPDTAGNEAETTDSPLAIDWIVADADSQTGGNLNDERVKLTNTGDSELDLSGYRIDDNVGKRFIFPKEFTLDAGASVYVHTGSGTDDADDLYMGYTREIWNDSGDTVRVYDDSGTLVASYTYDYPVYPR
jgi:hypothetical protein